MPHDSESVNKKSLAKIDHVTAKREPAKLPYATDNADAIGQVAGCGTAAVSVLDQCLNR
jgi:hypothetical protein